MIEPCIFLRCCDNWFYSTPFGGSRSNSNVSPTVQYVPLKAEPFRCGPSKPHGEPLAFATRDYRINPVHRSSSVPNWETIIPTLLAGANPRTSNGPMPRYFVPKTRSQGTNWCSSGPGTKRGFVTYFKSFIQHGKGPTYTPKGPHLKNL
ncbi:hypothetical protein ACJJTC_018512 [Scirpophaga incertulas]